MKGFGLKIFTAIFMFLILFMACQKDGSFEKIDSDVYVKLNQLDGKYMIFAKTERIYPDGGYTLNFSHSVSNNNIKIRFKNIFNSDFATMAPESADCYITLGKLIKDEYSITFELNKEKTTGKLIMSTEPELLIYPGGNVHPF